MFETRDIPIIISYARARVHDRIDGSCVGALDGTRRRVTGALRWQLLSRRYVRVRCCAPRVPSITLYRAATVTVRTSWWLTCADLPPTRFLPARRRDGMRRARRRHVTRRGITYHAILRAHVKRRISSRTRRSNVLAEHSPEKNRSNARANDTRECDDKHGIFLLFLRLTQETSDCVSIPKYIEALIEILVAAVRLGMRRRMSHSTWPS